MTSRWLLAEVITQDKKLIPSFFDNSCCLGVTI